MAPTPTLSFVHVVKNATEGSQRGTRDNISFFINFFSGQRAPSSTTLFCPVLAIEYGLPGTYFGGGVNFRVSVGGVLPVPDFFDKVLLLTILHKKFAKKS